MNLPVDEVIRTFSCVAPQHDIGKANPGFQSYDREGNESYRISTLVKTLSMTNPLGKQNTFAWKVHG